MAMTEELRVANKLRRLALRNRDDAARVRAEREIDRLWALQDKRAEVEMTWPCENCGSEDRVESTEEGGAVKQLCLMCREGVWTCEDCGQDPDHCDCSDDPCEKCGGGKAEDIDCGMSGELHLCEPCAMVEAPFMFSDRR